NAISISTQRHQLSKLAAHDTVIVTQMMNNYRFFNTLRPYSVYTIPVTKLDPGPDGSLGTADDPGTTLTYFDYPASLKGIAFQRPTMVNDSRADSTYKTIEVGATKRLAARWQLSASYAATKQNVPIVVSIAPPQ